jgi:DNA (cytosine-5)-methyltransferase 1
MMKQLTFGSLFAGVGGFDMGFEIYGECKFQVEWDKNCQNVLNKHWPDVPKWGDISTVSGAELPPVDVIIFGSPCQDLSVAGKRAGLEGARSGLFHEAIRIIKEMRDVTNGTFPRWTVWENVAGALSSNNGRDFATVINEMGKAGAYLSEYALLDAQFFGIPQRRRRVFLISCWDSATAAKCPDPLLPVSESLPGYFEKSKPKRKSASRTLTEGVGDEGAIVNAIGASLYHHGSVVNQDADAGHVVVTEGEWWKVGQIADTLTTTSDAQRMPDKQRLQAVVESYTSSSFAEYTEGVGTLRSNGGDLGGGSETLIAEPYVKSRRAQSATDDETWIEGEVSPTLNAFDMGDTRTTTAVIYADVVGPLTSKSGSSPRGSETTDSAHVVVEQTVYAFDSLSSNSMKSSNPDSGVNEVEVAKTLDTWRPDPSLNQGGIAIVEDATVLFENSYRDGARIANDGVTQTLSAKMGTGGGNTPMVAVPLAFDTQFGSNANVTEDISPTLKASQQSPSVAYSIREDAKANTFSATELDTANALTGLRPSPQSHHAQMFITEPVVYDGYNQKLDESGIHRSLRVGRDSSDFVAQPVDEPTVFQPGTMVRLGGGVWEGTVPTLRAESKRGDNEPHIQVHDGEPQMAVRRLTPSECELLMGWPLDHTLYKADGSIQSDTHRYKQIGNGVATPVARWVAKQIWQVEQL